MEFVHIRSIDDNDAILTNSHQLCYFIQVVDEYQVESAMEYLINEMERKLKTDGTASMHQIIIDNFKNHHSPFIQRLEQTAIRQCVQYLQSNAVYPGTNLNVLGALCSAFSPLDIHLFDETLMNLSFASFRFLIGDNRLTAINDATHLVTCYEYVKKKHTSDKTSITEDKKRFLSLLSRIRFPLLTTTFLVHIIQDVTDSETAYLESILSSIASNALCYMSLPVSTRSPNISALARNVYTAPYGWTPHQLSKRNELDNNTIKSLFEMEFSIQVPSCELNLVNSQNIGMDGYSDGFWKSTDGHIRGGWQFNLELHRQKDTNDNEVYAGVYLVVDSCFKCKPLCITIFKFSFMQLKSWDWSTKSWILLVTRNSPFLYTLRTGLGNVKVTSDDYHLFMCILCNLRLGFFCLLLITHICLFSVISFQNSPRIIC